MDNSLDLALFSDFIPAYEKNFVLDTHRIIFYSSIEIKNSITANTDEPVISQQLTKKAKEFLASEIDWLGKRAEKYFAWMMKINLEKKVKKWILFLNIVSISLGEIIDLVLFLKRKDSNLKHMKWELI